MSSITEPLLFTGTLPDVAETLPEVAENLPATGVTDADGVTALTEALDELLEIALDLTSIFSKDFTDALLESFFNEATDDFLDDAALRESNDWEPALGNDFLEPFDVTDVFEAVESDLFRPDAADKTTSSSWPSAPVFMVSLASFKIGEKCPVPCKSSTVTSPSF